MLRQILACLDLPGARSAAEIHCMWHLCKHCTSRARHSTMQSACLEPTKGLLHVGAQCLRDALQVITTKVVVCCSKA